MAQWKVRDVMTRKVVSVPVDATYRRLVDTLLDNNVSAAPVVDAEGFVVGVVSEADLLHKVESGGDQQRPPIIIRPARRAAAHKARGMVAAELMSSPAITVGPDTSVVAAARQLEANDIKRLPVIDTDGRLVGVVSRRDLLRMHTRSDSDILHDIADDVLGRSLSIDPHAVHVKVVDGVVTLEGRVETRGLAGLVVRMTAAEPGVVDVIEKLTWDKDDSDVHGPGYALGSAERLMHPSQH
jgi:CBS domain-containing protein